MKESGVRIVRTFTQQLPVRLSMPETLARGGELARAQRALDNAEEAKRESAATHGALVKRHQAEVSQLAQVINQGWEFREVECTEQLDYVGLQHLTIRTDTGEIVAQRPMNEQERQRTLPIGDQP
jgi:hypothetical protein